jgi:precorrin isomerase
MRSDSEFITCMSKKGGTPVAVSIVNALIIEAGQIEVRKRA